MLFPNEEYVDKTWETVCALFDEGKLGTSAKVSTKGSKHDDTQQGISTGSSYLICVYTYDHEDIPDLFRVLLALRDNGLHSLSAIQYKTDEATVCGEYATSAAGQRAGFESGVVPLTEKAGGGAKKKPSVCKYSSPRRLDDSQPVLLLLNNQGPCLEQLVVLCCCYS